MSKGRLAINVEYLALRFSCALVNAVPYPLAMAIARGLGWMAFRVFRFKRRRTLARIRGVFPEKSEREAARRAEDAWKNGEILLGDRDFEGTEYFVLGESQGDETDKDLERIEPKDV